MVNFFLITSAVLFIATYGIHNVIISWNSDDRPNMYLNPMLSIIPYLSGFFFSIIPLKIVFHYKLFVLFIANLIVIFSLSPIFANILLSNFANQRRGSGEVMAYSFFAGILLLILCFIFE